MALNFNVQGMIDAMTTDMIEAKDPVLKAARKNVVVQLERPVRDAIEYHTQKIVVLKKASGVVNAAAIKYHENQLEYYQS